MGNKKTKYIMVVIIQFLFMNSSAWERGEWVGEREWASVGGWVWKRDDRGVVT